MREHDVIAIFQSARERRCVCGIFSLAIAKLGVMIRRVIFQSRSIDASSMVSDRAHDHRTLPTYGGTRARETIGDTHGQAAPWVVFPGPLRSGFDQTRRVRAQSLSRCCMCLSRQAEHDCAVFAQPAARARARSAFFMQRACRGGVSGKLRPRLQRAVCLARALSQRWSPRRRQ